MDASLRGHTRSVMPSVIAQVERRASGYRPRPSLAVGVDCSTVMIKYAQRRRSPAPAGSHFVVAEAENPPFPDGTFTAVLCTSVLHYLRDPEWAIAEMTRVLRRGGRLAIGTFEDADQPVRLRGNRWFDRNVVHAQRDLTPFGFYLTLLVCRGLK